MVNKSKYCKKIRLQFNSIFIFKYVAQLFKRECDYMLKIQKGYDSESKTFRLPIDLITKLETLAANNKLSLNQLVIQCLNYAVENIENDTELNEK